MATSATENKSEPTAEPRGFGEHSRGLAGEYAHEQGWGLDEAERTRASADKNTGGGADFDYGAQDFGDEAVNTAEVSDDKVAKARTNLEKE